MPNNITEKRAEELKVMQKQLRELDESIQVILDGKSSMSQFAEKHGVTPQSMNNGLNKGLPSLLKRVDIATEEDIRKLLEDSMSPCERLINSVLQSNDLIILDVAEEDTFMEVINEALNEREREVINYRFGFLGELNSLDKTAIHMRITRERVRQIEAKALRKLRNPRWLKKFLPNYDLKIKELKENETMKDIEKRLDEKQKINTNIKVNHINIITTPLDQIGLTVRAYNCLKRTGINNVGQLSKISKSKLEKIRNLGKVSQQEIIDKLKEYGIELKDTDEENTDIDIYDNIEKLGVIYSIDIYKLNKKGINTIYDLSTHSIDFLLNILSEKSVEKIITELKNKFHIELKDETGF